jgi:hypothetical protein
MRQTKGKNSDITAAKDRQIHDLLYNVPNKAAAVHKQAAYNIVRRLKGIPL